MSPESSGFSLYHCACWKFGIVGALNIAHYFGLVRFSRASSAVTDVLGVVPKVCRKVRRRRLAADSRPRPQPFLQNVLQPAALFLSSHAPAFASPSYTVFDSNVKLPKMNPPQKTRRRPLETPFSIHEIN